MNKIKFKTALKKIYNLQEELNQNYMQIGQKNNRISIISIFSNPISNEEQLLIGIEPENLYNTKPHYNKDNHYEYASLSSKNDELIINFLSKNLNQSYSSEEIAIGIGENVDYVEERLKILLLYRIIETDPTNLPIKYSINETYLFRYVPYLFLFEELTIFTNKVKIEIKEDIFKIISLDLNFIYNTEGRIQKFAKPEFFVLTITPTFLVIYLYHKLNRKKLTIALNKITNITGIIKIKIPQDLDESIDLEFEDKFILTEEAEIPLFNNPKSDIKNLIERPILSMGKNIITKTYHIEDKFADPEATKKNILEIIKKIKKRSEGNFIA